ARRDARRLLRDANERERILTRALLDDAQVICATLATLSGPALERRRFSIAVVDEATQATEPMTLAALLSCDRVVLAGDPCQLPPTVLSAEAVKHGLAESALDRILAVHGENAFTLLREQYRMHESIMEFPSRWMYRGELRAHPSNADHTLADNDAEDANQPLILVDTAGKGFDEERDPDSESLFNVGEIDLVAQHAARLVSGGLSPEAIGVITPYSAQATRLREFGLDPAIEIDTVDAFQGREKDAILLSLVRSNASGEVGFLKDERRLNVALTRARRHLAVFGDSATLANQPMLAALIEYTQTLDAYRSAWAWPATF
ncbi:MAG: AAA domain-containing protein, partial [Myxococcota bacterium]